MRQRLAIALLLWAWPSVVWAQFPSVNISLPSFTIPAGGAASFPLLGTVGNCTTAPTYSFSGDVNTGFGSDTADQLCWVVGGVNTMTLAATGSLFFYNGADTKSIVAPASATATVQLASDGLIGFNSTSTLSSGSIDLKVGRIAADLFGPVAGDAFGFTSKAWISTAPTISQACAVSPSITWSNGTAAFQMDVGTTCAGVSVLVLILPVVSNAYMCTAMNVTTSATAAIEMTASTTGTATFTNYTRTTGVALVFVDGADVRIACTGG